jgi:hypothetical protein
MRAINHAVTGAIIGVVVNPWLAPLAAYISHFVLDAIPHHNFAGTERSVHYSRRFIITLVLDAFLCGLLVLFIGISQVSNWWLVVLCAFLGTSPDFMWLAKWLGKSAKQTKLKRFHAWVQWSETPEGWVIEVIWLILTLTVFVSLLAS